MIQSSCSVQSVEQVADNVFVLAFHTPEISKQIHAGQFVNIKAEEGSEPLLRRPFSVYRTHGDMVEIIFNVVGKGSAALRKKRSNDCIDVLGPLGVPFSLSGNDFETAILVGGGLGVAPLPISTQALIKGRKSIITFLGSRTANQLVHTHLTNVHIATDDGSRGFHGNVVELMKAKYDSFRDLRPKLFACGPTKMLHAVAEFSREHDIPCEVSLEGPMACGFGICQGCPVELIGGENKYGLMCKDGPTFDVRNIKI